MQSRRRTSRAPSSQPQQAPQSTSVSTNAISNIQAPRAAEPVPATTNTTRRSRGTTPSTSTRSAAQRAQNQPIEVLASSNVINANANAIAGPSNTSATISAVAGPSTSKNQSPQTPPSLSHFARRARQTTTTLQTTSPSLSTIPEPPSFRQLSNSFRTPPLASFGVASTSFAATSLRALPIPSSTPVPATPLPQPSTSAIAAAPSLVPSTSFSLSTLSSPTASGNFHTVQTPQAPGPPREPRGESIHSDGEDSNMDPDAVNRPPLPEDLPEDAGDDDVVDVELIEDMLNQPAAFDKLYTGRENDSWKGSSKGDADVDGDMVVLLEASVTREGKGKPTVNAPESSKGNGQLADKAFRAKRRKDRKVYRDAEAEFYNEYHDGSGAGKGLPRKLDKVLESIEAREAREREEAISRIPATGEGSIGGVEEPQADFAVMENQAGGSGTGVASGSGEPRREVATKAVRGGRPEKPSRTTGPMLSTLDASSGGFFDMPTDLNDISRAGGDKYGEGSSSRGPRSSGGFRFGRYQGDYSHSHSRGGLGPRRTSKPSHRHSPVGMSSRPYPLAEQTPSSSGGPSNSQGPPGFTFGQGNPYAGLSSSGSRFGSAAGFAFGNTQATVISNAESGDGMGPQTQRWYRGMEMLGDLTATSAAAAPVRQNLDDDNPDDDVPSQSRGRRRRLHADGSPCQSESSIPRRPNTHNPFGAHAATPGDASSVDIEDAVEDVEDIGGVARRAEAAKERELHQRRMKRLSEKGKKQLPVLRRFGARSSDSEPERLPTQPNQIIPKAFMVAQPVASRSKEVPKMGGVSLSVKSTTSRPEFSDSAKNHAGGSRNQLAEAVASQGVDKEKQQDSKHAEYRLDDRSTHTRTNTVASSSNSNTNSLPRLDSAVSQFPGLPGIPGSFEGLSGIGGQNELGVSQLEESLPPARYNSRGQRTLRTGPALSTIANDAAEAGVSFNPDAELGEPTESQMLPRPHSDIICNSTGNPVTRLSGEVLRSEESQILGPLVQNSRHLPEVTSAQRPMEPASGSLLVNTQSSQSTSSSSQRRKTRRGSYDPSDDKVSFLYDPVKLGEDPNRDRTGETTGPKLLSAEQMTELRGPSRVDDDDDEGRLAFGRSQQTVLEGVVRRPTKRRSPIPREVPTPAVTVGTVIHETTGPTLTTGVVPADNPADPFIDDDGQRFDPTEEQLRAASIRYINEVVRPDRLRRSRSRIGENGDVISDEDEDPNAPPPQPPNFSLVDIPSDDEALVEPAQPAGNVLAPNSSASAVDEDEAEPDQAHPQKKSAAIGMWHEEQALEDDIEDTMDHLFPLSQIQTAPSPASTPVGQLLSKHGSKDGVATQPSMSSLGEIPEGDNAQDLADLYPPNQEACMHMHRTNPPQLGESEFAASQPEPVFETGFTQFPDKDPLKEVERGTRPSDISRYPHADELSISTDNSVMRSQLFSSKLAAYNADQAGLKPGDEGYSEPPEANYVKWAHAEGFSDAGSTETGASIAPVKPKAAFPNPFANLPIRMPNTNDVSLSDVVEDSIVESTLRPSGDSFIVIPDSQEESQSLLSRPQVHLPVSTKFTDPRRRPAIDNGVHAYSEVGPSRSQRSRPSARQSSPQYSQSTKDRITRQSNAGKPYDAAARNSTRPPRRSSTTPASQLPALLPVEPSPVRSDAEAQIEADLIPETQYSQQTSYASSSVLGEFSPVIRYERTLERVTEENRQPIVLVPGTASASQVSNMSLEPSAVELSLAAQDAGLETDEETMANIGWQNGGGFYELSGLPQEESFRLSGIEDQNEYGEMPNPVGPKRSFELPDPTTSALQPQQNESKRKRGAGDTGATQGPSGKKARTVPVPPAPLASEAIRRTRSSNKRKRSPPAARGPLVTPLAPPRPTNAIRSRKQTALPRTPSPQPLRQPVPLSIVESSSPLSPLPLISIPNREGTVSTVRHSKSYLKGRTLVADPSASIVGPVEVLGTSGDSVGPQASISQDPFKSLAEMASKTRLGLRGFSKAPLAPAQKILAPTAKKLTTASTIPTRKRARGASPEHEISSLSENHCPPPSKKHQGVDSVSVKSQAIMQAKKPPLAVTRFASSPRRACQHGGRVFALWKKLFYTASVTSSWEGEDGYIMCQVKFDDGSYVDLPLLELYRCELQEGDRVKVPGLKGKKLGREGDVSAVPSWEERGRVSVRLAVIPKENVAVFDGKNIAVDAAFVQEKWKDRKATTLEDIGLGTELVRVQEEREKETKSKARGRSLPSAAFLSPPRWKDSLPPPPEPSTGLPSRRRKRPPPAIEDEEPEIPHKRRRLEPPSASDSVSKKPFQNHVFIHALAVSDDSGNKLAQGERSAQKQELAANIERLGGKVIGGFEAILKWGGDISDVGDRWLWEAGQLHCTEDESQGSKGTKRGKRTAGQSVNTGPQQLFLIANGANRNVKYMMALAAGIPCVDQGWIEDEGILPWASYLLPAGHSTTLGHSCSQWVDQSYADHPRTLKSLLDEPGTIRKAFSDKSVLFVYPSKLEADIDDDEFSHTYPYSALACLMGASRVEVVHDIKSASLTLDQYDAIVYEDDDIPASVSKKANKKGRKVICAGVSWVGDCLITGSFLRHCASQ